jgi:AmmeMemoRadiSam system protein B
MIRKPAVAGYFYPGRPDDLRSTIEGMVDPGAAKKKAVAAVSPHAGFVYSGPVAGALFSSIQMPERFVLLGPSHRMINSRFALMREGAWETPLGTVPVDADMAAEIAGNSDLIEEDEGAHSQEHSLEVQLPFIQYFVPKFSIIPISLGYQASFQELEELGKAVALGIQKSGQDVLIVASTDMSHYVSQETAERLDSEAIDRIVDLDPEGLFSIVTSKRISMCGFQPTVSALVASLELGAKSATLIKYQTSGEVSGDYKEVVGYAGIRIE